MDDSYAEFLGDGGFAESKVYGSRTGADSVSWDSETWTLGYAYTHWTSTGNGRLNWTQEGDEWTLHNASGLSFSEVAILKYDADEVGTWSTARPLGPLEAGGRIQWSQTSPAQRVDTDSDLGWAIRHKAEFGNPTGGHIHVAHYPYVFLGLSEQSVDEPILDGVVPIRSSMTFVRVPLGAPVGPSPSPTSGEYP